MNKISVKIANTPYTIVSEEDDEYITKMARQIDQKMQEILESDSKLSTTMAAVLAAMDFYDQYTKLSDTTNNLRGQLREYLEEMAKTKASLEDAKREIARLRQ